jgi:hypothetical protein
MIIPSDEVAQIAGEMLALRIQEQSRLRKISRYVNGQHDPPYAPKGVNAEYRWIMKKSTRNFLPLIVSVISQNLHVDGYQPSGTTVAETIGTAKADPAWEAFRANRMISRQHGVHRSVMKHGAAYVVVLPGQMAAAEEQQSNSVPVIRPVSPRRMTALYADGVDDEWPLLAVEQRVVADSKSPTKLREIVSVYDEKVRYILTGNYGSKGQDLRLADPGDPLLNGQSVVSVHDLGVCPVIRFLHEQDLDGETDIGGEVEPLMSIQDQINFDTFNLMMTEQYAAFRQRWVTGMASTDEDGRDVQPFRPGVDRVWSAEDEGTKFGEFEVSPLDPYINARDAAIRHMSTISQVPPYHLLGQIANLSAEALAAARDGLDRKISELQSVNTDPWRNVFRLSAKASGDTTGWNDLNGQVIWRDTSARSFAATIDGLTKAAQMLGVPVEELWRRIPGVTADDINSWLIAKQRADAQATIDAARQQASALQSVQAQAQAAAGETPPALPAGNGSAPQPAAPGGGEQP